MSTRVLIVHFSLQCYFIHFLFFLFVHFRQEISFWLSSYQNILASCSDKECKSLFSTELNPGTFFFPYKFTSFNFWVNYLCGAVRLCSFNINLLKLHSPAVESALQREQIFICIKYILILFCINLYFVLLIC